MERQRRQVFDLVVSVKVNTLAVAMMLFRGDGLLCSAGLPFDGQVIWAQKGGEKAMTFTRHYGGLITGR